MAEPVSILDTTILLGRVVVCASSPLAAAATAGWDAYPRACKKISLEFIIFHLKSRTLMQSNNSNDNLTNLSVI